MREVFYTVYPEDFTGLGLICVEGDTVRATTYREFVEGLYASDEFPAVESQWESVRTGS